MTMRSMSLVERGGNFTYEGSAEKVWAPEHGVHTTETITQILGPYAHAAKQLRRGYRGGRLRPQRDGRLSVGYQPRQRSGDARPDGAPRPGDAPRVETGVISATSSFHRNENGHTTHRRRTTAQERSPGVSWKPRSPPALVREMELDENGYPPGTLETDGRPWAGWDLAIPEEYGGQGLPLTYYGHS